MVFKITEVFGYSVEDTSAGASASRTEKLCPFQPSRTPCTKVSKSDPLGVCMFGDTRIGTPVCPVRFIQNSQMFADVARAAFGTGRRIAVRPELRILRKENGKKAGKVDYIIAALGDDGKPGDFCALEVQSVYVSGSSYYPMFHQFLATGSPPQEQRGMDWLSYAYPVVSANPKALCSDRC
jgi:Restriction endonuclease NotI